MMADDLPIEPLVSVIIPTYNRPAYLMEAVRSVLAQTWRNLELIVQDNASERDPTPLLTALGDARLRVIRHDRNIGQTANMVTGCQRATGEYVTILGDDDLWHPGFLSRLVPQMVANPDVVVSFCEHDYIDVNGRVDAAGTTAINRKHRGGLKRGVHRDIVRLGLVSRSICALSAAVYRRDAIEWDRVPLDLAYGFDNYINYLAARTGKACYYDPEHLAKVRLLPQSASRDAASIRGRELNGRTCMGYWDTFYRDQAVASGRPYFAMKRSDNALRVLLCRLQKQGPRASLRELMALRREGMLSPLSLLYHLRYGKN